MGVVQDSKVGSAVGAPSSTVGPTAIAVVAPSESPVEGGVAIIADSGGDRSLPVHQSGDSASFASGQMPPPHSHGCDATGFMSWAASNVGMGCGTSDSVKRKIASMWAVWGFILVLVAMLAGHATGCVCCRCCKKPSKWELVDPEDVSSTFTS